MGPLQLIALTCLFGLTKGQVEDSMSKYPDPRIVIVGPTGVGKSSLSNALLGCDPELGTCAFPVCASLNSCTKETTIGTGQWLGDGDNFTVVDTPGFGDSDGEDNKLIEEMINVLDDDLGYTNIILLLLDGTMPRFTSGLHNMLRQMSSLFGDAWWDNMIIGVSKWEYSQAAITKRKKRCDRYGDPSDKCKEWLMREIRAQLQDKFHLDRNFTFAFIHSHSQTEFELEDPVQQEHYQAQADILWKAATTGDSKFDFKTIDDVLEENELLKKKYRKLNFLFETNIATLYSLFHENKQRINGNAELINENKEKIDENVAKTNANITTLLSFVHENQERINVSNEKIDNYDVKTNANITTLLSYVHENKERIRLNKEKINNNAVKTNSNVTTLFTFVQENKENTNMMKEELKDVVDNLQLTPIGTIIAWVTKPTKENAEVVEIPDGWHRCDGSMIPKPSIWAGKLAPNLNHEKRFLRGGPDKDMLNLEEDELQDHEHIFKDPKHDHGYHDKYTAQCSDGRGPNGEDGIHDRYDCSHSRDTTSVITGITIGKVTDSYRRGEETRPKNMNVIYIMRVW